ncbi:MAG: TIGR02449 family protein [Pseudomonadales bacterium]|nr:TIGR02449 family protein [Pseudomonadales bacterium]
MDQQQFIQLERKVDELIKLCAVLKEENDTLKSRESSWGLERSKLVEKNELARNKIEAMIVRLKSLEQNA